MKYALIVLFALLSACAKKGSSVGQVPASAVPSRIQGCHLQSQGQRYWTAFDKILTTDTYYCPQYSPGCFIYLGYLNPGSAPAVIKDECSMGGEQKVSQ